NRVVVSQVSELSEAWRRGLRPQDQIVSFAGRDVTSANEFQNIVGIFPEGTRLPLQWRNKAGLREATIRLRPLHGFQKAPELPEERQPKPKPGGEDAPDDDAHQEGSAEELPAELKALFVEREGYCNYYFNEQQQQRLLKPLQETIGRKADPKAVWMLTFKSADSAIALNGELTLGSSGAGLKLNNVPFLQKVDVQDPQEEAPQLPGLLTAMIQVRKLLLNEKDGFSETMSMGRTLHLPLQKPVDILVTREGARTCRWYFESGAPMPVGVDVEYAQGVDEARLLFENWADRGGLMLPGRVGLISGEAEDLRWITIGDVTQKASGPEN
ncbi:MAG: hypothetical protein ACK58L_01925, partial [Planctomycetota bacterium]